MGSAEKRGASKRGIRSCPKVSFSTGEDCRVTIQSLGTVPPESLASSPESHKPRMTNPADISAQCIRPSWRERSAKRDAGISTLRHPFPSHQGRISLRAKPLQTALSTRCPTQAETIRPGRNCFPKDSNDAHIQTNKPLCDLLESTAMIQNLSSGWKPHCISHQRHRSAFYHANSSEIFANPRAGTELSS